MKSDNNNQKNRQRILNHLTVDAGGQAARSYYDAKGLPQKWCDGQNW